MNEVVQHAWQAFCSNPGESTFDTFYAGTSGFIFTICLRVLGDSEEASDVTQTVYSSLLTLAHSADGAAVEDIDDVVRRLALRHAETRRQNRRRTATRQLPSEELATMAAETPCTRTTVAQREVQAAVRSAIEQLSPEARQMIHLQYEEGLTHQEIADRLGRSRSRTSRLIQQAAEDLQLHLKRAGITESVVLVLVAFFGQKALHASAPLSAAKVYTAVALRSAPLSAPVTMSMQLLKISGLAKSKTAIGVGVLTAACVVLLLVQLRHFYAPTLQAFGANSTRVNFTGASVMSPRIPLVNRLSATSPAVADPASKPLQIAGTGQLLGTVVSRYTQDPVQGVRVHAVATASSKTVDLKLATATDANGQFIIGNVPPGEYEIRATAVAPWVNESLPVAVVADEPTAVGPIQLNRVGAISGTVIQDPNGEPVAEARVQVQDPTLKVVNETKTDVNGRFVFKGLTLPFYTIYLPEKRISKSVGLISGRDESVVLRIGTASLTGKVQRAAAPLAKAYIRAYRSDESGYLCYNAYADSSGVYQLPGLTSGEWAVQAMPVGRRVMQMTTSLVNVTPDEIATWDAVIPSGELAGKVKDESGNAVAGIMVRAQPVADSAKLADLMPSDNITSTTADGEFHFAGLPPGEYTITASRPDGLTAIAPARIPDAGEARVELQLTAKNTGSVQSTALSFDSEQPVQDAWCILMGSDGVVSTPQKRDARGRLRIDGLRPGRYTLNVSAHGYSASTRDVEVTANQVTSPIDVLQEAGALHWILFNEGGIGKPGVQCRIVPADPTAALPERTGWTDKDGNFDVRGMPPGKYLAIAESGDGRATVQVIINSRSITEKRTQIPLNLAPSKQAAVAFAE